jgi:hypothetical protein
MRPRKEKSHLPGEAGGCSGIGEGDRGMRGIRGNEVETLMCPEAGETSGHQS